MKTILILQDSDEPCIVFAFESKQKLMYYLRRTYPEYIIENNAVFVDEKSKEENLISYYIIKNIILR